MLLTVQNCITEVWRGKGLVDLFIPSFQMLRSRNHLTSSWVSTKPHPWSSFRSLFPATPYPPVPATPERPAENMGP